MESMMEAFAVAFTDRLQELVKGFNSALEGLPAEALDWSPGPQMNSLTVLATHSAAAVRYLIGDVIAGDSSHRVREEEFRAVGVGAAALSQRLAAASAYAQDVVTGLTVAELGQQRFSPQHNTNYTVAWCMFRALDHLSEHIAHAQLTRLLWEQQVKSAQHAQ
jgi:hypothetical protein